jgi:hypothetical protein
MYKVQIFFGTNIIGAMHTRRQSRSLIGSMWRECFACMDPNFVRQGSVYKVTLLWRVFAIFFKKRKKKSFVRRIEELTIGYSAKYIYIYIYI